MKNIHLALSAIVLMAAVVVLSGCISSIFNAGNVPIAASGDNLTPVYGPDNGSSGEGWTMNGAIVDFMGMGDPIPAFKTFNNQYMYKNVGLTPNMVIEFDAYIQNQGDQLGTFYFLCDSTGKGSGVTLEGRQNYHSTSFINTYNWTAWGYSDNSEFTVPAEQWVHVKIDLADSTGDLYINYTDNKNNHYTFSQKGWTFDNEGGYVGFNGNGGSSHAVWWDNLVIYRK